MVVFTCSGCGDSLKKNKVKEHKFRCRSCQYVTCIDCIKDFFGNEWDSHTKCISEQEKYGNKVVVNKGEKKQEEWIEKIQRIIALPNTPNDVKHILEKISTYSNIPRKFPKFKNFLQTSLNVRNPQTAEKIWKVIEEATKSVAAAVPAPTKSKETKEEEEETDKNMPSSETTEEMGSSSEIKLSKRERKEKRRLEKMKVEKKDKVKDIENGEPADVSKKSKKAKKHQADSEEFEENGQVNGKKRKRDTENDEIVEEGETHSKKKKNKKTKVDVTEEEKEESIDNGTQDVEETTSEKLPKFKIESVVTEVLQRVEDHSLPLKKLRKKVLAEYFSGQYKNQMTEEKMSVKLMKKLNSNPSFKVHKERVTLKL